MVNYDNLSDEEFDAILVKLVEDMDTKSLLAIPGVYEAVRKELNNDVLNKWERGDKEETVICGNCGSKDVLYDAYAYWDEENQEHCLNNVFDDHVCGNCGEKNTNV